MLGFQISVKLVYVSTSTPIQTTATLTGNAPTGSRRASVALRARGSIPNRVVYQCRRVPICVRTKIEFLVSIQVV